MVSFPTLRSLKLQPRLMFSFVVVSLLATFVATFVAIQIATSNLEVGIERDCKSALKLTTRMVDDYISRSRSIVEIIASMGEVKEFLQVTEDDFGSDISLEEALEGLKDHFTLAYIEILSPAGKRLFEISGKGADIRAIKTHWDDQIVIRGLQYEKVVAITEMESGLAIKAIAPIIAEDYSLLGLVVATFGMDDFFADTIRGITRSQVVIYTPKMAVASSMLDITGNRPLNGRETPPEIFGEISSGKHEIIRIERYFDNEFHTGYIPLKKADGELAGIISSSVDRNIVITMRNRIRDSLFIVGFMAVIISALAAFRLARGISEPVSALTKGAILVGQGNLSERIEIRDGGELGQLANSFNKMTKDLSESSKALNQKLYELSLLNKIGEAMNFTHDSESLLTQILDNCLDAFDAARGSLMLLDEEGDELKVWVVRGIEGEFKQRISLKAGEGIAGQVVKTGEAVIVNKGADDPRFKSFQQYRHDERAINNMLCVPLIGDAGPIGVINVINKKEGDFSLEDRDLLMTLAVQAATAIVKSRLYEMAIKDGMTKLYIHRYFQARLKEEVVRCKRYGTPFSLILSDIDHFKSFNDTYGHQQGDIVLIEVAKIFNKCIRKEVDLPARYGGEEFAIILPDTDLEGAIFTAERLRKEVESHPFPGQDKPLHVTISLGVAYFPDDAKDGRELIECADKAMYYSKENGRNQVAAWQYVKDIKV